MAGQALGFGIKVVEVQAASAEEIAHKHCLGSMGTTIERFGLLLNQ